MTEAPRSGVRSWRDSRKGREPGGDLRSEFWGEDGSPRSLPGPAGSHTSSHAWAQWPGLGTPLAAPDPSPPRTECCVPVGHPSHSASGCSRSSRKKRTVHPRRLGSDTCCAEPRGRLALVHARRTVTANPAPQREWTPACPHPAPALEFRVGPSRKGHHVGRWGCHAADSREALGQSLDFRGLSLPGPRPPGPRRSQLSPHLLWLCAQKSREAPGHRTCSCPSPCSPCASLLPSR